MARNKKRRVRKHAFLMPRRMATLVIVSASVAMVYLWMSGREGALCDEIKRLENQRVELRKEYSNEEFKWTSVKSPRNLQRALAAHRIPMTWPDSRRVVRMTEGDLRPAVPRRAEGLVRNE